MDLHTGKSIFVDDTDPGIIYHGEWILSDGLPTEMEALTDPEQARTPLYGTLHKKTENCSMSYIFDGTAITASFLATNLKAIRSCLIDDIPQTITDVSGETACVNTKRLSQGSHNLTIALGVPEASFDGLIYTPSHSPETGVDIAYEVSTPPVKYGDFTMKVAGQRDFLVTPGDRLDIEFNGFSIGIYAAVYFDTINVALLSYIIDHGLPVNFTLPNTLQGPTITDLQLILQSPVLPPGKHNLSLTFLGSKNNDSSLLEIFPQQVIVQNTTQFSTLETVPSVSLPYISATITSNEPPTNTITPPINPLHSGISRASIISISVSLCLALILAAIFLCWCTCRARSKRHSLDASHRTRVDSFCPPHPNQPGRFRLGQYTTREKTEKYREAVELPASSTRTHSTEALDTSEGRRQNDRLQRVRYVIHEDGGQVAPSEEDEVIVNLPPVYGSIGGASTVSTAI